MCYVSNFNASAALRAEAIACEDGNGKIRPIHFHVGAKNSMKTRKPYSQNYRMISYEVPIRF